MSGVAKLGMERTNLHKRIPALGLSRGKWGGRAFTLPIRWGDVVLTCIQVMTETLSVRLDSTVKKRLDALAQHSRRSKSFLAAEAIAAYVQAEEWQLAEIRRGLKELDAGQTVSHERVSTWLRSWGKPGEGKAPR